MSAAPPSLLPSVASALAREVLSADAGPDLVDNVDRLRFPNGPDELPGQASERLAELLSYSDRLQILFDRLDEPGDRELLIRVLAYRVLGHRKVSLPMSARRLDELIARAWTARTASNTLPLGINGWHADDYDLTTLGYPLRLRVFVGAVVHTFELEQYRCPGALSVAVRPGDVVIDGGGYCGDTALYFAHLVGRTGRVSCFEFEPHNLELLGHNLRLNPRLSRRIDVIESALWDRAGEQVPFREQGPGTVIDPSGEGRAATDTIDDMIERRVVQRVDFIKLDIEGAELNALRGAEATLRRFRPRLAIAAYHRADDLATIPEYLSRLDVGYRFRLRHPTMHTEETVLFACADGDRASTRMAPRIQRAVRRLSTRRKPFTRGSGH